MSARALVIDAGRGTEIALANQDYSRVVRGLGRLATEVEPDLYSVTVRVADSAEERTLIVSEHEVTVLPAHGATVSDEGGRTTITIVPPRFVAAMPQAADEAGGDDDVGFVAGCAEAVTVPAGGGGVLLVARARGRERGQPLPDPADGVTLLDEGGGTVAELARGRRAAGAGSTVALGVALAPGWYRLRMVRPAMPVVEQAVVVAPGWQTQVFLLRRWVPGRDGDRLRLSMAMRPLAPAVRRGRMYEPDQRATELAIQALDRGRRVASPEQLEAMLADDQLEPLLALITASQLDDAPGALRQAVTRLRAELGPDHPDVEALALALPDLTPAPRFPRPPMLTASWQRIVARSATDPEVVPAGSLTEQVARHLYGTGAWLWWNADEVAPIATAPAHLVEPTPVRTTSALHELVKRGAGTGARKLASASRFGAVLQRALPEGGVDGSDDARAVEQRMVETVGVPRSVLEQAAAQLLEELPAVAAATVKKATVARPAATTKPAPKKAAVTRPVVTRPVVTRPAVAKKKPVVTKPVVTKAAVARPVVTKAAVAKAAVAKAAVAKAAVAKAAVAKKKPAATRPAAKKSAAKRPAVTKPAAKKKTAGPRFARSIHTRKPR